MRTNPSSKNNIEFDNEKKKFLIKGDEDQLYRVFVNLIKNSEESLAEKKLKIKDFKGKIHLDIKSNNDYIDVTLIDNGTGISDTKKIMNPYYTTKKDGTGLGLPIVSKIISEHNGELSISNNQNEGVKIIISFPKKSWKMKF